MIKTASQPGNPVAQSLRILAGALLLFALGMAPLNYGSTRPAAFENLILVVAAGGVVWLLSNWAAGSWWWKGFCPTRRSRRRSR